MCFYFTLPPPPFPIPPPKGGIFVIWPHQSCILSLLLVFNDHLKMINNAWSHDSLTSCAELHVWICRREFLTREFPMKQGHLGHCWGKMTACKRYKSQACTDAPAERFFCLFRVSFFSTGNTLFAIPKGIGATEWLAVTGCMNLIFSSIFFKRMLSDGKVFFRIRWDYWKISCKEKRDRSSLAPWGSGDFVAFSVVSEMMSSVCGYLLSQKQKIQYLLSDPTSRDPVLSDCRTPVRIACWSLGSLKLILRTMLRVGHLGLFLHEFAHLEKEFYFVWKKYSYA